MSKSRRKKQRANSPAPKQQKDFSADVMAIPKAEKNEERELEREPEMVFNEPKRENKNESVYNEPPREREIRVVVSEPQTPPEANAEPPKPAKPRPKAERIGDLLREARLERGDDLYLIAEYLCIKPAFLIALENSKYDEFPADAYIIGFLRTYANFLGIDGKAAVDRYRYEMAGRRKKPVLSMPSPVSEGRTPSPIVMVGATIVLILIYTLWYNISSPKRAEVHVPPPLPTAVQPVPNTVSDAAAGLTAPLSTATTPVVGTATPMPSAASGSEKPATDKSADKAEDKHGSTSSTTDVVIPPASPGIVVTAGGGSKNPFLEDPKAKAEAEKIEKKAVADALKEEKRAEVEAKKDPDAAKTEAANKKAEAEAKAKLDKPSDDKSRIVIKATENSWVMIVDDSGKTILDKVLKPGEAFKVPNTPGLSMTTGNGNGIAVMIDGKETPKVSTGAPHVVRNIALDPTSLQNPRAE